MSTASPSSLIRRQVYVDIPPSPFHTSAKGSRLSVPHKSFIGTGSTQLKENTRPPHGQMSPNDTDTASNKRKASETLDPAMTTTKKTKLADGNPVASGSKPIATQEFPNGYISCHQCGKKRDPQDTVQCTFKPSPNAKDRRCHFKFCQACLKNRYDEDIKTIKASVKGPHDEHVQEPYMFKCPKCRDICNCPRCRKAKGLEAMGKRKIPAEITPNSLQPIPAAKSSMPVKPVVPAKPIVPVQPLANLAPKPKPERKRSPKLQTLPIVHWTRLRTSLTPDEVQDRMQIREFALRFTPVLNISKVHHEELSRITGNGKSDIDEDELTSWVSETCVKSLILGLLNVITEDEENDVSKELKEAMKQIRSAGVNLTRIWALLESLRETLAQAGSDVLVSVLDPLPAPISTTVRSTRSMRGVATSSTNLINVVSSAQLVPVIAGLIEATLSTTAIRKELDEGTKDGKERTRAAREAIKTEKDRWEIERKELETPLVPIPVPDTLKLKMARSQHVKLVQNLENSLKVAIHSAIPRFTPLGTDNDGRIYWALTPGVHDRDDALDVLLRASDKKAKKSKSKKRHVRDEDEDGGSLTDWSYFVAVWGTKPVVEGPVKQKKESDSDSDDESDDDEEAKKWWAFGKPSEIASLANWVGFKGGLHEEDEESSLGLTNASARSHMFEGDDAIMATSNHPAKASIKQLVYNLRDYGSLLAWRTRPQDAEEGQSTKGS
ncbi:hypothetical protein C8J56DRAFT_820218 [Mycena floridula]|nr:hypothetical protein C8J56DRAFT_820218 [Mycena floridula]